MNGLTAALHTASSALDVFSQALGVDESNIANSSTPGYAAQSANIAPIGGFGSYNTVGSSGDAVTVTSSGNAFVDAVVRAANSQASASKATVSQLTPINQQFDITGSTGIIAAFQQFSKAFSNLAVTPNDPTASSIALSAAGSVATAFQSVVGNLDTQSQQLAQTVLSVTGQINTLAGNIAQLNGKLAAAGSEDPSMEADLRNQLDQLSSLIDITVNTAPNGTVAVLAGGQLPLVMGDHGYTLSTNLNAAPGSQILSSGGGNPPTSFSGQLGALLETQNNTIDALIGGGGQTGSLNTLAAGFATLVNTALSSGTTAAGQPGQNIYSWNSAADAARTLTLGSPLTGSDLGIASATQSNGVANYLGTLPSSNAPGDQIGGFSAEGFYGSITGIVGQQLADATAAQSANQSALTAAGTNRQQLTGVSLDQEAINVTAYERAYQANAQVVSILNQLTQDTLNLISPTSG